jgi:hypothetical protein
MKCLFKWLFRLSFLLVLLIVAVVLGKDAMLKAAVARQIRAQTGMDVKIGRFSVGVFSPVVTIEDFRLFNTPEFGGTPFVDIPELHVEYDRAALAQRKLHIKLLRFNLAELNIVKNEAGHTNLVSMMHQTAPPRPQSPKGMAEIEFAGIDVLNLSLGRLRLVDLKDRQRSGELYIGLRDQVFRNVKSQSDLVGVLFLIWLRSGDRLAAEPVSAPSRSFASPAASNRQTSAVPARSVKN